MSQFPSLPLFTDAYIADTTHLTNEEHGAYLRLLMFAWRSPDCRLADDDARLARMLGLTAKKWASLKPAVMAFWTLENGYFFQKRLAREHQVVTANVERKRAAGSRGGLAKALNNKETDVAPPSSSYKQNGSENVAPNPNPNPIEANASSAGDLRKRIVQAFADLAPNVLPPDTNRAVVWLKQGYSPDVIVAVIREVLARNRNVSGLSYFERPLAEAAAKSAPVHHNGEPKVGLGPGIEWPRSSVQRAVTTWEQTGSWPESQIGPPPGQPGCRVPSELLPGGMH